jgi:DNA-binding CsgD family transcriptional regulator/tetratricopeptide (TPR) repeat protein
LLVASARDDEAPVWQDGGTDLAAMPGVSAVRLTRLDAAATAALAIDYAGSSELPPGVLDTVVAKAAGLPVVVPELLDALLDGDQHGDSVAVPPSLSGLVRRRLALLTDRDRDVLGAAAVLGPHPDWSLVGDVADLDPTAVVDSLRAGTDAGLLVAADGGAATHLGWRHALVRDAVVGTLLPPQRVAIAARAGAALCARDRPGDDVISAELFEAAGERDRAADLYLRQARVEASRGALRGAEQLLNRAAATNARRIEVAKERVGLLTVRGRGPEALAAGAAVLPHVTGDAHADLCLQLARAAVSCARWETAEDYVARAGRPDDPESAVLLAETAFGRGDPRRAAELAGHAVECAEAAGAVAVQCAALVVAGRCALLDDDERAVTTFQRAAQLAAEHGLQGWRVEAMSGLGLAALSSRDDRRPMERAHELAIDAGMLRQALSVEVVLAEYALVVDGPKGALHRGVDLAQRAGSLGLTGLQALGEVLAACAAAAAGDIAWMEELLASATSRPDASIEIAALASVARVLPALLSHDLPTADRGFSAGLSSLVDHGSAAPLAFWGAWALLRTVVADDEEPCRFLRTAPPGRRRSSRAALAYCEAVAAGRRGRKADAVTAFEAGEALHVDGWWRRVLRLVVLRCAVLDGWGDPVPQLRADLTEFERGGDERLARTCRDLLRQAGAPTRRGRGAAVVPSDLRAMGVTSREVDVLELVADGLSNADIALRLFLSPRTVETHVTNLLAKTGSADRAVLRRLWAARLGVK